MFNTWSKYQFSTDLPATISEEKPLKFGAPVPLRSMLAQQCQGVVDAGWPPWHHTLNMFAYGQMENHHQ